MPNPYLWNIACDSVINRALGFVVERSVTVELRGTSISLTGDGAIALMGEIRRWCTENEIEQSEVVVETSRCLVMFESEMEATLTYTAFAGRTSVFA